MSVAPRRDQVPPVGSPVSAGDMAWLAPVRIAWDTSPAAIVVALGPRHRLVYQNDIAVEMFGPRPLGLPMMEAFPETLPERRGQLDQVFTTGRPVHADRSRLGVRGVDGDVHVDYVMAPLVDARGDVVGVVVTSVDRSGQALAEVASNRAALLGSLAERVSAAADARTALDTLTRVLVPDLADVATVYVVPDSRPGSQVGPAPVRGSIRMGEAVASARSRALEPFGVPPSPPLRSDRPPWPALASGRVVLLPAPDDPPGRFSTDPATQAWLTAVGARNLAIVPLVVAGTLTGALVLLCAGDRDPYRESDLPFLADVAARAAVAVAQVRAHQRQVQVSHDLQQALLPAAPVQLAGLQVAARYLAGVDDVDVGGDWWDVVALSPARVAVGVGDVSGRGIDAAVVMGHARAAMRAATLAGLSPARVLGLLDVQLRDLLAERDPAGSGPRFATALHAVIDLDTGHARLSSAGHLPALLHRPGQAAVQWTTPPRPPLALGRGGYTETTLQIPVGGSLLLYTDGLVEDRRRDLDVGLGLLARLLESSADLAVGEALDHIVAGMLPDDAHLWAADDVAVVLMRLAGAPPSS